VRHLRGDTLVEETDLYELLLHGVRSGSARFESGDTLLIPPVGSQVAISGAVLRPAIYELKPGEDTLQLALDHAGGSTAVAALDHITVERVDENRSRETLTVNSGFPGTQWAKESIPRFVLHDGDRVHVSSILPYSERVLYLEGHVVRPGRLAYSDGMQLSDVLHSYRDLLPEPADKGELVRLVPPDLHAETSSFDVSDVLIGNSRIPLQPFDTIRVFGRYQTDAPKATITGEVLRPGTFPLSQKMTAAELVRLAGGFKRDAYLDNADLTSYSVEDGKRVISDLRAVRIGAAVNGGDKAADVPLKPGDILTIHQVTGWTEIGESVTIEGQVCYPGSYGLREGEHLSSVLRRAGGFRGAAYPDGTILVREEVLQLEEKSRQELIRQIETSSSAARLSPALGSDTPGALQLIKAQQDEILGQLKSQSPTGRLVIHINTDIESWADSPADIELRRGDVITIPKRPGFVLVAGQVYNATALTFTSGKTAGWYLSRAGGTSSTANRKEIFVIRANGSVIGRRSGRWLDADVLSTKLNPGDVVVVPQRILGSSQLWRNLLTAAQLASSIAITATVAAL
jgi:protein involved in polysaccharide export with SLBB domain